MLTHLLVPRARCLFSLTRTFQAVAPTIVHSGVQLSVQVAPSEPLLAIPSVDHITVGKREAAVVN